MALAAVLFLTLLARPLQRDLNATGIDIPPPHPPHHAMERRGAGGLRGGDDRACKGAVLVGTIDIGWLNVLNAEFALAGLIKCAGALVIVGTLAWRREQAPASVLLAATVIVLAAATLTTHANARLDNRLPLLLVEGLHQLGAAILDRRPAGLPDGARALP